MNEKELRKFIIRRFIRTAIIVAVVEFILIFMIMNALVPVLADQFFPELLMVRSVDELLALPRITRNFFYITAGASLIISILPLAAGAVIFSNRITSKLKEYEAAREAERAEVNRQRYLMISDIAHDLKTPMTTVTGYAKALRDGMVKEDQEQEYLDAISEKTLRMNDIVQMLFDYVRLDSEGFALAPARTDVCELVRECVANHYSDIETAGDEVDIDIPDDPIMVNADRVQLSRVITNLIVNAVKHNPKGTTVGVYLKEEPDEVRLFVTDSGAPIDAELAKDIFEPFVMGDKSRSSGGGSGLGLSVASKIASLHGFKLKLVQRPEMLRYQLGEKYKKVFLLIMPRQED